MESIFRDKRPDRLKVSEGRKRKTRRKAMKWNEMNDVQKEALRELLVIAFIALEILIFPIRVLFGSMKYF